MKQSLSIIFVLAFIALSFGTALGQQAAKKTIRWGDAGLTPDCCSSSMQEGSLFTTYQDSDLAFLTVLQTTLDKKYFMVYISVENRADAPLTIYPENFQFRFTAPINKTVNSLNSAEVVREIEKRGGTTRYFRTLFAAMAHNTTTVNGSTTGSISMSDIWGNSASGTYSSGTTARITTPNLEEQRIAREKNREDIEKNANRASNYNRLALRAHTLEKGESKEGVVFFRMEKFSPGTVLSFTLGDVTYEVPFGSERVVNRPAAFVAPDSASSGVNGPTSSTASQPSTGAGPVVATQPDYPAANLDSKAAAGAKPANAIHPTIINPSAADPKTDTSANGDSSVSVRSTPEGAEIEVNGSFFGSTPSIFTLSAGQHRLMIKKPGFLAWERTITIQKGGNINVLATLEANNTRLTAATAEKFASNPPIAVKPADLKVAARETAGVPVRTPGETRKASLGIELVWIPPGEFLMGSINGDKNERPAHTVKVSEGFWMSKYETTQEQWLTEMGQNPSDFSRCGSVCPVDSVTWEDAKRFVARLNSKNDGYVYSLPSEAEWEYAATGGVPRANSQNLDDTAWYSRNALDSTMPVGTKRPNGFGLYDMTGNVWEWCEDWFGKYSVAAETDPRGPASGKGKVLRGGSWRNGSDLTSPWARVAEGTTTRYHDMGVRIVARERR